MAQFKGVRKLSQKKYKSLKDSGELDNGVLYVTPETNTEKIEQLETTVSELTPKVMRSLVTPVSTPTNTELVAVDNTNAQTMLEIGDGLSVEGGKLKVTSSSVDYQTHTLPVIIKSYVYDEANRQIKQDSSYSMRYEYDPINGDGDEPFAINTIDSEESLRMSVNDMIADVKSEIDELKNSSGGSSSGGGNIKFGELYTSETITIPVNTEYKLILPKYEEIKYDNILNPNGLGLTFRGAEYIGMNATKLAIYNENTGEIGNLKNGFQIDQNGSITPIIDTQPNIILNHYEDDKWPLFTYYDPSGIFNYEYSQYNVYKKFRTTAVYFIQADRLCLLITNDTDSPVEITYSFLGYSKV